ncbi:hypothetical protein [Providencia phage PSTCR6]|nr:hypothetical protein [Providencia phage PSTCR6]
MSFQQGMHYKLVNVSKFVMDPNNVQIAKFIKNQVFKVEELNDHGSITAISIDGNYYNAIDMGFHYKVFATDEEYDLFSEMRIQKHYCITDNNRIEFFDTLKECQDQIKTKVSPTNWAIYKLAQTADLGITFNDV